MNHKFLAPNGRFDFNWSYVQASKTFKKPVLTISNTHFLPFSDMSMGHKISHGRIYALFQYMDFGLPNNIKCG